MTTILSVNVVLLIACGDTRRMLKQTQANLIATRTLLETHP